MPGHDLTADRLAMRIHARQSNCPHGGAVEVKTLSGERVAWLCPGCDAQLAAGWRPPRCTDCSESLGHPSAVVAGLRVCLSCARKINRYGGTVRAQMDTGEAACG